MPDNPPAPPDPNAAIKAETDRLNAQAALERAGGERIRALGLPSFEGKTTLNAGAGAIEGLILATDALFNAAALIAEAAVSARRPEGGVYRGLFLVLAGDEQIDFGLSASIRVELDAFAALFRTLAPIRTPNQKAFAGGTAVAALGALAGLLRTDTEISGLDFAQITHRPLATATAARLGPRAILPGAAIGPLAGNRLADDLMSLAADRDRIAAASPDKPDVAATLARFDAFCARVLTPDAAGQVPIARAGRLQQLLGEDPLVLRVFVEKAGGSLVVRKNIGTLFWADPVRVSAGLVASYTVTEPSTGRVLAAGVLNCRTGEAKLSEVQSNDLPSPAPISASSRDDRHAQLFGAAGNADAPTGRLTMADYFQLAGDAIEAVVIERKPSAQYTWPTIQPRRDWGMTDVAWEGWLDDIRREFRNRIAPAQMKPEEIFAGSAGKDLSDLRWRLAGSIAQAEAGQ